MSLDINIKKKKEKQKSPLDINNIFPNYINKNVFRGGLLLIIIFTVFVYLSNGGALKFGYYYCPVEAPTNCININYNAFAPLDSCEAIEYFSPGESCGVKPNFWAVNYNKISLVFVVISFLVNHLVHFLRTKSFKIPFNRQAWDKHPLSKLVRRKE